jgi:hypothetical protein
MKQCMAAMYRHVEAFMPLTDLGDYYPAYQSTCNFAGDFVDAHRRLARGYDLTTARIYRKTRRWFGSFILAGCAQ